MAKKRMFDNEIISQDSFIDLPKEAIALYFLLGMEADDEGFVAPKKVMRVYAISDDTLKILVAKNYIIPFKSGVVVITDWKRNNYLDKNRITPTIYQEEKEQLVFDDKKNKYLLNACGSSVKQMLNDGLTSIEENSIEEKKKIPSSKDEELRNHFELIWKEYPNKKGKSKAEGYYFGWLKGRKINSITRKITDEQMYYAVRKYAKECEDNKIEQQYIKHGDTFFNSYILDYVE
jgi:hypothetical protein